MLASDPHRASWLSHEISWLINCAPGIPADVGETLTWAIGTSIGIATSSGFEVLTYRTGRGRGGTRQRNFFGAWKRSLSRPAFRAPSSVGEGPGRPATQAIRPPPRRQQAAADGRSTRCARHGPSTP